MGRGHQEAADMVDPILIRSLDCTPSMKVPASFLTLSTVFSDRNE